MKLDKKVLDSFINDPNNKINLVNLADNYMDLNQHAMAYTYYMKCAEACEDSDYILKYHCLMSIGNIFYEVGNRWRGALQYARYAKTECPDRPEAYYLEAVVTANKLYNDGIYEQDDWIKVYEASKVGSIFARLTHNSQVKRSRYYPGIQQLYCYYLVSTMRLNKYHELMDALTSLDLDYKDPMVFETVSFIYDTLKLDNPLTKLSIDKLNESIRSRIDKDYSVNSSKYGDDILALLLCDKKSYIEFTDKILSDGSNTLSLENLGWKGIQVSQFVNVVNNFTQYRSNKSYCFGDNIDYRDLINSNGLDNNIGYLSINCKSSDGLSYLFAVKDIITADLITFRHDGNKDIQSEVYTSLHDLGYIRISTNIKSDTGRITEDWYIRSTYYNNLDIELKILLSEVSGSDKIGIKLFQ